MVEDLNRQRLSLITSNISSVKNGIKKGYFPDYRVIYSVMISETIVEVRKASFTFQITYTSKQKMNHCEQYKSHAKKYKAKLISDLEEVLSELGKRHCNLHKCITLMGKMLETNLYSNFTQGFIDKHVSLSNQYKYTELTVA